MFGFIGDCVQTKFTSANRLCVRCKEPQQQLKIMSFIRKERAHENCDAIDKQVWYHFTDLQLLRN